MRKKWRVLIVGSGGREEAIYAAIRKSPFVSRVYVAPGNDSIPEKDRVLAAYDSGRYRDLILEAVTRGIHLVIVGPDDAVVNGIWDAFQQQAPNIAVMAPSCLAAELEGSKIYMKTRCVRWDIPTAAFDFAGTYQVAEASIKRSNFRVVKADGLCGGKGVTVASTEQEALEAARLLLVTKGQRSILLEEALQGWEFSYFALCDGENFLRLPCARDYKQLKGLMTGGMGAYSPVRNVGGTLLKEVEERIIRKLLHGMASEGRPYHGILYAGIMQTSKGPHLLEVNCRFGDPEAQVILPRIHQDLLLYFLGATQLGGLAGLKPLQFKKKAVVCVCLADKDYPSKGHRLASLVGTGRTVPLARENAYRKVKAYPGIQWLQYNEEIAAEV